MIVSYPNAGLGNRVMCITSCLYLAETMNRDCRILWTYDNDVNCDFFDLFKPNPRFKLLEGATADILKETVKAYESSNHQRTQNWKNKDFALIKFSQLTFWENKVEAFVKMHNAFDTICINTWQGFGGHAKHFEYFCPVDEVAKAVDKIDLKYRLEDRIGIHIRTTDHFKNVDKSNSEEYCPPRLFIDLIDLIISSNPTAKFFVATDDESVTDEIRSRFEGSIVSAPKNNDRYSLKGAYDALIDAYCLSRTKTVVGNYYSSFSHMAANLGGKQVVKPQNFDFNKL